MSTVKKGNRLEDQLYDFFLDQYHRGELVFDVYPATLCEVHKKKKYYCAERNGDVEFDVVVEVRRRGSREPHIYVVFECKNHRSAIQERDITDFSDKIRRVFGHAAKGVFVSSSRLQSGAENIARKRRLGLVKLDVTGTEVIADRLSGPWAETGFLKSQLLDGPRRSKSLKFSAYHDGKYFSSLPPFLMSFEERALEPEGASNIKPCGTVPYLAKHSIQNAAEAVLSKVEYKGGEVDLGNACVSLGLDLLYSDKFVTDPEGNLILGSMNFEKKTIEVNKHNNRNRERFTVAHEIGHFCLNHGDYLRSDSIVERDLFVDTESDETFNYDRLEYQANLFASFLLLPEEHFMHELNIQRQRLRYINKGFGYIYVDDQPCNFQTYNLLLSSLSDCFGASNQAVDVRLKRVGLVNDQRKNS